LTDGLDDLLGPLTHVKTNQPLISTTPMPTTTTIQNSNQNYSNGMESPAKRQRTDEVCVVFNTLAFDRMEVKIKYLRKEKERKK